MASFLDLPVEVLLRIFSFLPHNRDRNDPLWWKIDAFFFPQHAIGFFNQSSRAMSDLFSDSLQAGNYKIYVKTEIMKPVDRLAKEVLDTISEARSKKQKTSYTLLMDYFKKDIMAVRAELVKLGFSVKVQATHVGEDMLAVTEP